MTIMTNLTKLFTKKAPKNQLSIIIQSDNVRYGYFPTDLSNNLLNKPLFNTISVHNDNIESALTQLKSLPLEKACCDLTLSSKFYHIIQVDKPSLPDNELRAALTWQIKDLVPIEPSDMVIDYFDAPTLAGVEKINVVCASEQKLKSYIEHILHDKMIINRIIPEEFAFAELITKSNDATLLLCQQPNEDLMILIVKNGQLFSYRRIRATANIGLRSVDELGTGLIDNLSIEMQKSIDYFERQLKQSPVKMIKILMPIEKESFIARKLSENTLLPVELLSLPHPYNGKREFAMTMLTLFEKKLIDDTEVEKVIA